MAGGDEHRPIIIVRRKKVVHGHHGGAWKIAFADFMTALMALFLVLWVLSSSSPEQKQAVAEYFRTPLVVAMAGGDRNTASTSVIPGGGPDASFSEGERDRIDPREQQLLAEERERMSDLEERIEAVISNDPLLSDLREQILIEATQEGLRIQLVDTEQRPMFERGSERVAPYMRSLLRTLAPMLNELPNSIQISGHTDSVPYAGGESGYSNWELSADRAGASRRELIAGGLDPNKLLRVSGMADRLVLEGAEPSDARNRRITVVVLNNRVAEAILNPRETDLKQSAAPASAIPSANEASAPAAPSVIAPVNSAPGISIPAVPGNAR
ncbi:flagellar motor protein MotB [Pseudomonas sp. NW5]|uniref:flagellar motor protein MotB n=1 Tax=Pseudomonas sp. NW5 TaxID=2934934 RepID=UPI0020206C62|nr:flagellar motor protein MotB [Pseudomonas sp. NW5]MCL7461884.1 flagellar motor protein MotB [Pseudomonas sp. NW5]